ncbi:MAG TPA: type VI secretion system baseplate subunit TssE [Blastocatellia bacterium]|nr:type VI secretion system baseplate subunit TssE [Blastocatellia bacterium]
MPRSDNQVQITPSVLDRLIDYEPKLSREPVASRYKSLRQLKQSVRRDLEWLLNTRQEITEISPDMKELRNSLAVYGLKDFSTENVKGQKGQNRLRQAIETAVTTFEPRLDRVRVNLLPMRQAERALSFRIDARLKVEPAPEPVTFDTVLQLATGQYLVKEDE